MAAIVHRCSCGHLDAFHAFDIKRETRRCSMCACADSQPGAPEIIPTWTTGTTPTGQAHLDPELVEPGTNDPSGLGRFCDGEDCQALYLAERRSA